ncbi:MAG: 2-amino-4-hydroxy-6-hydroxymethyldihydropteridine diphosphokinase [Proteobacteria bacterium]|nr:2-amino-4-hydroxy-6-hydroxymethyldihydropteridine diphosphokinase [Pseudomonadota bacterium]
MRIEVASFIGLGSNLGDPVKQIHNATDRLASIPSSRIDSCSSLYQTPPMGPPDQPDYVNAVVRLATRLEPHALLKHLQSIECAQGRIRDGIRWGPRTIDLDLLIYGDEIIDQPGLRIPHPGIPERAFVLVPMAEIDPDLSIPGHASVYELLGLIDTSEVIRIGDPLTSA